MIEKGIKDKQAEEVQFAAFSSFCENTMNEKKALIKKANEMVETLEADIQKHEADADMLAKEISNLDTDITTWEGDKKASTKVRAIEKLDYEGTHRDYTESMEALEEGIQTLEKEKGDVAQAEGDGPQPQGGGAPASAAALSQIANAPLLPAGAKRAIASFLAASGSDSADEEGDLVLVSSDDS